MLFNFTNIYNKSLISKFMKHLKYFKSHSKKQGLPPISNKDSKVLILGTMPGEKSLLAGEYYYHPRNCFWKLISTIFGKEVPSNYQEKKSLLLNSKISIWDVCEVCERQGSLDNEIKEESPNNLEEFLRNHPQIKTIIFNGGKSAKLFDKYFDRSNRYKYYTMPSTSPANAGLSWEFKLKDWSSIKNFI